MVRKLTYVCLTAVLLASSPLLSAQKSKESPAAPIPAQITDARKIFIANDGGLSLDYVVDQTIFNDGPIFNGGPDRVYNQFYSGLKEWNQRDIVSSPADADLVLQVKWILMDAGLKQPVLGEIQVLVIDPKTHITLWNLTEYVHSAIFLTNRDKNFDHAMATVLSHLKTLMAPAASTAQK